MIRIMIACCFLICGCSKNIELYEDQINKGLEAYHENRIQDAISFFEKGLDGLPKHKEALLTLSECYEKERNFERAVNIMQRYMLIIEYSSQKARMGIKRLDKLKVQRKASRVWIKIKDKNDIGQIKEFMTRYPNSVYITEAKNKLNPE